jgi:N-methylhydantoinase A/oxoprolinase/acetone carboxylase beta subunit
MESSRIRLAADVGGTFTDVAAFDETTGELRLGKTLTTPARLVTGVENGVTKAGARFSGARLFLHGTTVAINTILERTGASCALLTTQGFRDIYEIGRVNRPESYNLFFRRHQPLIERDLRYEIRERMDAHGKVLIELDEDQVRAAVADAVRQGVEAIAILFLHSYRNPAHEQRSSVRSDGIVLTMLLCSANDISVICSILTKDTTTRPVRTYRCTRTRRSRAPSSLSVARWRCQFWAGCTTNISGRKFPTGTTGGQVARETAVEPYVAVVTLSYPKR